MNAGVVARAVAVLAVVGTVVVLAGGNVDTARLLTAEGLRDTIGADEWYGPIGYVAVFVAVMFLPVPKAVVAGLAGVLFGPAYGFAWAWVGQIVAMTVMFLVARTGLRDLTRRFVPEDASLVRRLDARLEHHGVRVVAGLRLFYFMGTPMTVVLATTHLRLRDFVIGTAIGVIPAIALMVLSADAVTSGKTTAIEAAVIGVAVVLVFGLGTLVRRRLGV